MLSPSPNYVPACAPPTRQSSRPVLPSPPQFFFLSTPPFSIQVMEGGGGAVRQDIPGIGNTV